MSLIDRARLAMYRFHEKGLEVFLIESDLDSDPDVWNLPTVDIQKLPKSIDPNDIIELDVNEDGKNEKLIAIPGDWHNIPSIRGMIKHDIKVVKSLVKQTFPQLENGSFKEIKDCLAQALPSQKKALLELKEILQESNSLRNL